MNLEENNVIENIVPSKPFKSFEEISDLATQAKGKVARIQVDICDGEYVKNVSWPFSDMSKNDFSNLYNSGLDLFMPEAYEISYSADLMCLNPEKYIDTLIQYGFNEIIIHWRSIKDDWVQVEKILDFATNYVLDLYIAVDVNTNVNEVKDFFKKYAKNYIQLYGVQVMGIENIGVQKQPLDKRSLEIVKDFKIFFQKELNQELEINSEYEILFDGCINGVTINEIKESGVDIFCVGSFLTEGDFKEKLKFLKRKINF